jgi:hypothetical protein
MNNRDWSIEFSAAVQQPDSSWVLDDGTTRWYNEEGDRHRLDGPAIINDGNIYWYLNNVNYSFDNWCTTLNIPDETKFLLRLRYE